ncbi:3984_t:CDS:1, partial [Gigaspora margarita]
KIIEKPHKITKKKAVEVLSALEVFKKFTAIAMSEQYIEDIHPILLQDIQCDIAETLTKTLVVKHGRTFLETATLPYLLFSESKENCDNFGIPLSNLLITLLEYTITTNMLYDLQKALTTNLVLKPMINTITQFHTLEHRTCTKIGNNHNPWTDLTGL